jgi:hypothetical protein
MRSETTSNRIYLESTNARKIASYLETVETCLYVLQKDGCYEAIELFPSQNSIG